VNRDQPARKWIASYVTQSQTIVVTDWARCSNIYNGTPAGGLRELVAAFPSAIVTSMERGEAVMGRIFKKARLSPVISLLVIAAGFVLTATHSVLARPSHSSTIAYVTGSPSNERWVVVVNRDAHSVSVIKVRENKGGFKDVFLKLADISVGSEPRCVAADPDGNEAYVTNAVSGTVSVIALKGSSAFTVVAEIPVGTELRGCALTPNSQRLYVANHTEGTVSIIDPKTRSVIGTVVLPLGEIPRSTRKPSPLRMTAMPTT
jgi:YVTN family beta-propeller protein